MFDNVISTIYMTCLTAVKHIVVSLHGFETTVFTREHNRRLVKQERGEDTDTVVGRESLDFRKASITSQEQRQLG